MSLSNWEIAVYALYLRSGASRRVHTEEVALKCFEIAPDSFSWIKYREHPDKEIVRIALMDARKEKLGELVSGRSGKGRGQATKTGSEPAVDGWQLTVAGAQWVTRNEERLAKELGQATPKSHRQELLHKLARVRNHPLFRQYAEQPSGFVPSVGSLAELLRCRVDAEKSVWEKRLEELRMQAELTEQQDTLAFVQACRSFLQLNEEGRK